MRRTPARCSTTATSGRPSCSRRYAAAWPTWPPAASASSCRSTSSSSSPTKLQGQAEKAIGVDREDLAREALTRKSGLTNQINDLKVQLGQLQGEEEKLTLAQSRLAAKVEAFRTRKETIKATYTAAEAQTRINEAVAGIGEEMGDVGLAIQRAEDKTAQMQARAGAVDELIASGALDDVTQIGGQDDISRELEAMSSQSDVESELARLKAAQHGELVRPVVGGRARRRLHAGGRRGAGQPARRADLRGGLGTGGPGVIVRILGEGQYDVTDDALDRLNALDAEIEAAVEAGDEAAFATALTALHDGVRGAGTRPRPRLARRVRRDPAARGRHHRRGARAAGRRRFDPRLNNRFHGTLPLHPRHRPDRPDDHGHVPARARPSSRSSSC